MTIKLIVMDFDGVVCNTSRLHFNALNRALSDIDACYCVSEEEDFRYLGSKTTKDKLKLISQLKGLPADLHESVLNLKKKYTQISISSLEVSEYFSNQTAITINRLKGDGYLVYLASNTNREFINLILDKIGLVFDKVYCSNDVVNTKPHPEIYMRCLLDAQVAPDECVILEDSVTGQEAAIRSGSYVFPVEKPSDVNYDEITSFIKSIKPKPLKWQSRKINVIIPMAGEGSRFKTAGWVTPKPLIEIHNLPMVANVIKDLNIDAKFTFIIKEDHEKEYHLSSMLKLISPDCNIVKVAGKQSGAATTILQARRIFDNDSHMMIVNSDQMWDWDAKAFYQSVTQTEVDGSIIVFEDKLRDKKWSFARVGKDGRVLEVAEKNPISDLATAGIYYFTKGSDFVKYAEQMISCNDRTNGEFYVCPIYNYMIAEGKKISTFCISKFWPTGTPEELNYYLANRVVNV